MTNYNERDTMLGRRFVADVQVMSIGGVGAGDATPVRLRVGGDDRQMEITLSFGKLKKLIAEGLLIEPGVTVPDSVASLLRDAAGLIDDARSRLDVEKTTCEHCSRDSYRNYQQSKAHDRLTQMMERLLTLSRELSEQNDGAANAAKE